MEYLLLCLFFQYDLRNYHIIGNYYITNNLQKLFTYKNIQPDNLSKIIIFFETSDYEIIDFLKNKNFEWIIIKNKNQTQYEFLTKEIKNFGHEFFCDDQNLIIILKKNDTNPALFQAQNVYHNIDLFISLNILETKLEVEKFIAPNKQLIGSLTSVSNWLYVGEEIPDRELLKCQMFAKMRISFIICKSNGKIIGYFLNKYILKDFWIYYLSKDYRTESILNLNINKLEVPIFV